MREIQIFFFINAYALSNKPEKREKSLNEPISSINPSSPGAREN